MVDRNNADEKAEYFGNLLTFQRYLLLFLAMMNVVQPTSHILRRSQTIGLVFGVD